MEGEWGGGGGRGEEQGGRRGEKGRVKEERVGRKVWLCKSIALFEVVMCTKGNKTAGVCIART